MKEALKVLSELVTDGVIEAYAIGGAMGVPRPLSESQYAKMQGRRNLADLPFPEKVKCVIELQRRLQPIYAQRGIYIKPWRSWN